MSDEIFMEQREYEQETMNSLLNYEKEALSKKPQEMQIVPGTILKLSKESAEVFHEQMRSMILEKGYGLFEYLEVVKFFGKINDAIFGKDGTQGDWELIQYVREELAKSNGKLVTSRGVKFEMSETGTKYDYSTNEMWLEAEKEIVIAKAKKRAIEERLKKIEPGMILVDPGTGESLIGPVKTSKSSIKVTMA